MKADVVLESLILSNPIRHQKRLSDFDVIDLDGSGTVSFEEYKKVNKIYGLDEATARKIFDEVDGDRDGSITKEEHLKTQDWFFTKLG